MSRKFVMNVMDSERGLVVAICDLHLLGKVFEEDDKILDISSSFFTDGREAEIEEIIEHIKVAYTVNIVGNEIVQELISHNIINVKNTKKIAGIAYAHIYRVE